MKGTFYTQDGKKSSKMTNADFRKAGYKYK